MNTGHRGTLATIHASSAEEALYRLATLAIRGNSGLTLPVAENEVARSIDMVVYVQRTSGMRTIGEIRNVRQP
jgi:pilus assembly protein CpaF